MTSNALQQLIIIINGNNSKITDQEANSFAAFLVLPIIIGIIWGCHYGLDEFWDVFMKAFLGTIAVQLACMILVVAVGFIYISIVR